MKTETNVMFTKMSAKTDIKKFGEKAVSSIVKEYNQIEKGTIEGNPVVTPIDPDTLF